MKANSPECLINAAGQTPPGPSQVPLSEAVGSSNRPATRQSQNLTRAPSSCKIDHHSLRGGVAQPGAQPATGVNYPQGSPRSLLMKPRMLGCLVLAMLFSLLGACFSAPAFGQAPAPAPEPRPAPAPLGEIRTGIYRGRP